MIKQAATIILRTIANTTLYESYNIRQLSKIPDQLPLRRRGAAGGGVNAKKKKSPSLYTDPPHYKSVVREENDTSCDQLTTTTTSPQQTFTNSDKMNTGPPLSGNNITAATATTNSSTYGITPEQASKNFDVLRREATKLERHLEDRVARYQQLAQRLTVDNNNNATSSSDNDPLGQQSSLMIDSGGGGSSYTNSQNKKDKHSTNLDEEEATLSKDIHRTMSTMTELINTKMAPAAERTGRSQHLLLVKRYREILFDCGADFNKTSAAVARRREAKELFRGATASTSGGGDGPNPEMEQLLRERNAIDNSMKSANSVLNQAASVRSELRSQGASLRGVGGTMATIAGNIPGLNGLIDKIRKKRQQDDRVVSGVVAACILFTLWYLFG